MIRRAGYRCALPCVVAFLAILWVAGLMLIPTPAPAQEGAMPGAPDFAPDTLRIETAGGGQHDFTIEIADDNAKRAWGLMHRTYMAPDAGMLFDFKRPQRITMWMKDTEIPLDMLFIDADGVIRSIAARTVPHSLDYIRSPPRMRAVLELNAGTASRLGIGVGDRVRHGMFE